MFTFSELKLKSSWNQCELWLKNSWKQIMVDNMSRGDPGRPPQALSPSRIQQAQEVPGAYLSLDSGSNGNANSPRSPRSAEDDYDYQMNNMSLLKAQLKVCIIFY